MTVVINPGTGAIPHATEEQARRNLAAFLHEAGFPRARVSPSYESVMGRWDFTLRHEGRTVDISVPGCPLEALKGEWGEWSQPRLYVNGSSWWWKYAIAVVREAFGEPVCCARRDA